PRPSAPAQGALGKASRLSKTLDHLHPQRPSAAADTSGDLLVAQSFDRMHADQIAAALAEARKDPGADPRPLAIERTRLRIGVLRCRFGQQRQLFPEGPPPIEAPPKGHGAREALEVPIGVEAGAIRRFPDLEKNLLNEVRPFRRGNAEARRSNDPFDE